MKNPFDRNFFHFLFGFAILLGLSFSILFFTGKYADSLDQKASASSANAIGSVHK